MQKREIRVFLFFSFLLLGIFLFFFLKGDLPREESEYGEIHIEEKKLVGYKADEDLKKEAPLVREDVRIEETQIQKYNEKFENKIFTIPENQHFPDFEDEDGNQYTYKTLNQEGLSVPIPKGFEVKPKGSFLYFSPKDTEEMEEYKGVEISVRCRWVLPKRYNYKAAELIFVRDIYNRLFYHDAYDKGEVYIPYPDHFDSREVIYDDQKNPIGMSVFAKESNFILEKNPVFHKLGAVSWNFVLLEDQVIQVTVMAPCSRAETAKSLAKSISEKMKRNAVTDHPISVCDTRFENDFISFLYPNHFKVIREFFDTDQKKTKLVFSSDPMHPEYFMQLYLEKRPRGEVAGRKETIRDLRASDIFDDIKDYLYLSSSPRDINRSYYQMHNLNTRRIRIGPYIATENQFQMLYDSYDFDTDELHDGQMFTIYLINYSDDEFIVMMFNSAPYQKKLMRQYVDQIMKTVTVKKG